MKYPNIYHCPRYRIYVFPLHLKLYMCTSKCVDDLQLHSSPSSLPLSYITIIITHTRVTVYNNNNQVG